MDRRLTTSYELDFDVVVDLTELNTTDDTTTVTDSASWATAAFDSISGTDSTFAADLASAANVTSLDG